jgi:hypothetical protein
MRLKLSLTLLPDTFALVHLQPEEIIPSWAVSGEIFCVMRTHDELSIVCREDLVVGVAGDQLLGGMRALKVAGPLAFTEVGILDSLAAPLARAGLSIFVISTFDTDYLLVSSSDLVQSLATLRAADHTIVE